jgi:hypothetical protein
VPSRKGSPNKAGAQVKENLLAVFTRIGGTHEMAEWAKANRTEFYRLYARLVPTDIVIDTREKLVEEMTDAEINARIAELRAGLAPGETTPVRGEEVPTGVH